MRINPRSVGLPGRRMGGPALPLLLLVLLVVSSMGVAAQASGTGAPSIAGSPLPSSDLGPLVSVGSALPASLPPAPLLSTAVNSSQELSVLVTLPYQNSSELSQFLRLLVDPQSPEYHHYLTASQFDASYSPSPAEYSLLESYLEAGGAQKLSTFSDRTSLGFEASLASLEGLFHTSFGDYQRGGTRFVAPLATPELPARIAALVAGIDGLDTDPLLSAHLLSSSSAPLHAPPPKSPPSSGAQTAGYLAPASYGSAQLEYAPDFQVAYGELGLFQNAGYPRNAVVATILWSGFYEGPNINTPYGPLTTGESVGPFVPNDVYQFYNETLPSSPSEPHSVVVPVPVGGAPYPGNLASWDSTGANVENTLDLEMVGSSAPGATIYNVYGPSSSSVYLDEAFATVLSPPSNDSGLLKVNAISNSWGAGDHNDSSWYSSLEQAQARGITVLASSGDAADNPSSSKWVGSSTEFPSSMAYNTFGDVAVGGTTVQMDAGLHLTSDTVWNISSQDTGDGGPAGSSGGISSVFPEPSWQSSTSANQWINGAGRGVPDIAAVANNTLMTITEDGYQYRAVNATDGGYFFPVGGTSVASPLTAGIVAEIDHVLGAAGQGNLGFLDPIVYPLGNQQFAALTYTATTGYDLTGTYNSSLPALPFLPVDQGRNFVDFAHWGYSLVTGWGTIDAANFTLYELTTKTQGVYGRLSGVADLLSLNALDVTSTFPGYAGGGVNTQFNASLQQNFFLADSLGAPIYWVQNVVYITNVTGGWDMTFSGWVVFPFYGLYPSDTVYAYNFPSPTLVQLPQQFDVYSNLTTSGTPTVDFSVGSHSVSLPVPGAAYIMGALYENYSWEGQNFSNGPFPGNPTPGGLSPQFGLVGGPSLGIGNFLAPTSGTVTPEVRPFGSATFELAASESYSYNIDETGESASNLTWTSQTGGAWSASYQNGADLQGVVGYEPHTGLSVVTFSETGLPTGDPWWVNVTGVGSFKSTSTTEVLLLTTGLYSFTVSSAADLYSPSPGDGTLSVSGSSLSEPITFAPFEVALTVEEFGLASSQTWSARVGSTTLSSSTSSLLFSLLNGTYAYQVYPSKGLLPSPGTGSVDVQGSPLTLKVHFAPENYTVTFSLSGTVQPPSWSVDVNGVGTYPSSTSAVGVSLANGSYSYTLASGSPLYRPSPRTGSVTVAGANQTVTVGFVGVEYSVDFTETGLPGSVGWYLNQSGATGLVVPGPSITESLSNGSYTFTAASQDRDYRASPATLTVTVSGQNQSVRVVFVEVTYSVAFLESAGVGPAEWALNLSGTSYTVSSPGLTLLLDNGSYTYELRSLDPTWKPQSAAGALEVTGANRTVSFTFVPVDFSVVFRSATVSDPYPWEVQIGSSTLLEAPNGTVSVGLTNGTYAYQVLSVNSLWQPRPAHSTLSVTGSAVSVALSFSLVEYRLTFEAVGLPIGENWSVDLGAPGSASSTNGTLAVELSNGSYSYSVQAPKGETATPSQGALVVNGQPQTVMINFQQNSTGPTPTHNTNPLPGGLGDPLLWVGIAAAVVLLAAALLFRRHRRK